MSVAPERAFDHVIVVIFENEYRSYARANPYLRGLAAQGTELAASFGVFHPSHTNYVASQAGTVCNITQDPIFNSFVPCVPPGDPPAPLQQPALVDRIHQKGLTWKAYMEGYQPVRFPPQLDLVMSEKDPTQPDVWKSVQHTILDYVPYMNMHNPVVRFHSVMTDPEQWARIRPIYELFTDALNGTLPECSWVVPHLWGDGHYLWGSPSDPGERAPLVHQQAFWLQTFFDVLRIPGPHARLPKRTLVIVTYDEADFDQDYIAAQGATNEYDGPNQIFTVLLGDVVSAGAVEHEGCNHYTILRTIEKNFGLDDLGTNDTEANWLQFLWGRAFRWDAPAATPIGTASFAAAAGTGDSLSVVYGTADGVRLRAFDGSRWGGEQTVPAPSAVTAAEACAVGSTLVLVTQNGDGLSAMTLAGGAWSQPQTVAGAAAGAFALAAYRDYHDSQDKAMLAWTGADGVIQSQIFADGSWSAAAATGLQTDGDVTLAVLGASLFLIAKIPGSDTMNVISYNTADFNVVTGTKNGYSDTTRGAWSPSAFPVAHFGRGPRARDTVEVEPVLRPYTGAAPFASATLDGVVHLATNEPGGSQVSTTTFSLSGIMTPLHPVDYATGSTGSNGYGTLAQAGWTLQAPVARVANAGAMAMARFGDRVALLFQPSAGAGLQLATGGYVREGGRA